MGITYGDHLIDTGHYDITPEQEREIGNMTVTEHPVKAPIRMIQVPCDETGNPREFIVGRAGVTRIEACTKSGLHADIPYVRVWSDQQAVAEFCQHSLSGVYFELL